MTSLDPTLILAIIFSIFGLVTVFALIKIYLATSRLNKSFAKLGYVNREDAKKYFEDAAEKVVDMNSSFYQQYQKMIEDGVRNVLTEGGKVMEGSLSKAQQDAGKVILEAQQEAKNIKETAKHDTIEYYERAVSNSVAAIEWTLEQYLHQRLDVRQHEAVIRKLLEVYTNERKS